MNSTSCDVLVLLDTIDTQFLISLAYVVVSSLT